MKIPLVRIKDALEKKCPFICRPNGDSINCMVNNCMSWTVVIKQNTFEDHSGGHERAQRLARQYDVLVERNSIRGSEGLWFVGPLGYCKRLWPAADSVTPLDYESSEPKL